MDRSSSEFIATVPTRKNSDAARPLILVVGQKISHMKNKIKISILPIILVFIDCMITLMGQPNEFWENLSMYRESNIISGYFLKFGAVSFMLYDLACIIGITIIAISLPYYLSKLYVKCVVIGEIIAIFSWLTFYTVDSWRLMVWLIQPIIILVGIKMIDDEMKLFIDAIDKIKIKFIK